MATKTPEHELQLFLAGLDPACVERVSWRGGQIQLEVETYLTDKAPPAALTSSGRCIVRAGSRVLLMSNPGGTHILPGGRIEPDETIEAATMREVFEETRLHLAEPRQVAVLVFRHLTPRPVVYRYPYPVFLNAIFVAEATNPDDLYVNDTYEMTGEFVARKAALKHIPEHQRVMLGNAYRGG